MKNKFCPYCGHIYKKPLPEGVEKCPVCKAALVVEKNDEKSEKKSKEKADKGKEGK